MIQWLSASVANVPTLIYYTCAKESLSKLDTVVRVLHGESPCESFFFPMDFNFELLRKFYESYGVNLFYSQIANGPSANCSDIRSSMRKIFSTIRPTTMIRTFAFSTSSLDWKKAIDGEIKDMKNSFSTVEEKNFKNFPAGNFLLFYELVRKENILQARPVL